MTEHELMLTSILKCRRIDLYAQDMSLSASQEKQLHDMKSRREQGEPLQYVIGETEFCGLLFSVDQRVLIPRPETEVMVETISQYISSLKKDHLNIHEVGTGSGCIAISLATKFSHVTCHAIDISEDALCVAQHNVERHNVSKQVSLQHVDATEFLTQSLEPICDMIISNPPYIPTANMQGLSEDVKCEPQMALDGGDDGLMFYRMFIKCAPKSLKAGGMLVCEFWDGQDAAIEKMFDEQWQVEFFKDVSGVNRFFIAQKIPVNREVSIVNRGSQQGVGFMKRASLVTSNV